MGDKTVGSGVPGSFSGAIVDEEPGATEPGRDSDAAVDAMVFGRDADMAIVTPSVPALSSVASDDATTAGSTEAAAKSVSSGPALMFAAGTVATDVASSVTAGGTVERTEVAEAGTKDAKDRWVRRNRMRGYTGKVLISIGQLQPTKRPN